MRIVGRERPAETVNEGLVVIGRAVEVLQRRMGHGDVIALIVDVAHRLPVDGRLLCPDAAGRHHLFRSVVGQLGLEGFHHLGDRGLRAGGEADEDKTLPDLAFERFQRELVLVERREAAWAGGTAQRAVEIVDPAVERTDQRVAAASCLVRDEARAAMAADIVEGAHRTVLSAQDQCTLADDIHGEIVAGLGNVGDMAGDLPVLAEDMLLFQLQKRGAVITPAGKSAPVPIVGNADIADHLVHVAPHYFAERSFNISTIFVEKE